MVSERAKQKNLKRVRPKAPTKGAELSRINELTVTARTSWFGLISYFAFAGVTLLGVQDADFFIPARETQLPLIGVSIPTALFFWVAPSLGAALFAYLQLHLMKLWEALAEAKQEPNAPPLSDRIKPWLISDFALSRREDGALRHRPMQILAHAVAVLLTFLAAPLLLLALWYRSMPAHHEWMTVLACGLPTLLSAVLAWQSWRRLHLLAKGDATVPKTNLRRWTMIGIAFSLLGWMTTEGTLDYYARYGFGADAVARSFGYKGGRIGLTDEAIENAWWSGLWVPPLLVSADLAGVEFVKTPPGWRSFDVTKEGFRLKWCKDRGIDPKPCWSGQHNTEGFEESWWKEHRAQIADLPDISLKGRDLRKANLRDARLLGANLIETRLKGANLHLAKMQGAELRSAEMQGAVLSGAQMQGAVLSGAQMQGANFSWAQMQEANLSLAKMQGADLSWAQMQGANLSWANMRGAHFNRAELQGADLSLAQMQGAVLDRTEMQGADLLFAEMQGAVLRLAEMDAHTNLNAATFQGAALRGVNFTHVLISNEKLNTMFGDGSVTLPGGKGPDDPDWPGHWPKEDLGIIEFDQAWRAWQDEIGFDRETFALKPAQK